MSEQVAERVVEEGLHVPAGDSLDAGIRLEQVREVFTYIRENLDEDVTTVNIVLTGSRSVVTRSGEELIDLVQKGQGVLNILPLAGVKEELDATIVALFPTEEAPPRAAAQ